MKMQVSSVVILLTIMILTACASNQLTRTELNEKFPTLVQLEKELDEARTSGVSLLAPELYQTAFKQYLDAYLSANNNQYDDAKNGAQSGLDQLKNARNVADSSRKVLSEVLDARRRAKEAGADKFYPKEIEENDSQLVKISKLLEDDDIKKAKNRRNELQRAYTDLELRSLQISTVADATAAIKKAIDNDAKKLAPKTLANAVEELSLSKSVLEVDRTNRDKANDHARRAKIAAMRSDEIATLIKKYKKQDYTEEDMLLSYQADLEKLAEVVGKNLGFDKPNEKTVMELQDEIKFMVNSNTAQKMQVQELESQIKLNEKNLVALREQHAAEIAKIESRYSGEISILGQSQEQLKRQQQEQQARFEHVQNLFSDSEANVFRKKNNVLISVHGFKFPSGSTEIRPENYGLMTKIVQAVDVFKNSKIIVSGHTDSTGDKELNKALSESRAQSVAKFFVDAAKVEPARIKTQGFGQEKPVASNESVEGRAKNRRVEILIVNE